MYYKKGINVSNSKQMFNFLIEHFTYDGDIANNVKLYNLNLSGDIAVAQGKLQLGENKIIEKMIDNWKLKHEGYEVGFDGRSDGYLVLYPKEGRYPYWLRCSEDYEDYKQYCKDYEGGVIYNKYSLVPFYKVVRDFDKLCDHLRDYVDELSTQSFNEEELFYLENGYFSED